MRKPCYKPFGPGYHIALRWNWGMVDFIVLATRKRSHEVMWFWDLVKSVWCWISANGWQTSCIGNKENMMNWILNECYWFTNCDALCFQLHLFFFCNLYIYGTFTILVVIDFVPWTFVDQPLKRTKSPKWYYPKIWNYMELPHGGFHK